MEMDKEGALVKDLMEKIAFCLYEILTKERTFLKEIDHKA
jgi:hypothetical protein